MIRMHEIIGGKPVCREVQEPVFAQYYEIAVIGLGTAGAISAIVSAGSGRKTLGVERLNAAGGTMTMSGVCGYYFGGSGGAYERVDSQLIARGEPALQKNRLHPDLRKYNLDWELELAGAEVCYEHTVTALYTRARRIVGLRIFDGKQEQDVAAGFVIDATGEGTICQMAGCRMRFGRAEDGSVVPFTVSHAFLKKGCIRNSNHDSGKVDHRDPFVFSKAVLEGQRFFVNPMEGRRPLRIQPLPGIREGRLLCGRKIWKASEFLDGIPVEEPVIYAYADLDKHGCDVAFDSPTFRKWDVLSNLGALNVSVPIPKECLIPGEYDNLLAAGRFLSVDHELQTCVRMNRDMQKLGEVAAVMADIALSEELPTEAIPYEPLRRRLMETGCLSEENNKGFWYDMTAQTPTSYKRKAVWLADAEQIREALNTWEPGVAIWSCRLLGSKVRQQLLDDLNSPEEKLRKHSAFALAVMEDPAGCGVLRQMVKQRDRAKLQDMRKNNKQHLAMAVCALGLLKDAAAVPLIKDLIADREESSCYASVKGFKEDYYRVISAAVAALMEIAEAHRDQEKEILQFLEEEFSGYAYVPRMIAGEENPASYKTCLELYDHICRWRERVRNRQNPVDNFCESD